MNLEQMLAAEKAARPHYLKKTRTRRPSMSLHMARGKKGGKAGATHFGRIENGRVYSACGRDFFYVTGNRKHATCAFCRRAK